MAKEAGLNSAKREVLDNLEEIKTQLLRAVAEGMLDLEDGYYNELLGLIDDALTVDNWDELIEAVTKAKTLENDVVSWMSRHGRTTLSLPWPKKPKI